MRLEPDIFLRIGTAHPMWVPMVIFAGGFPRARRISISREDRVLFRSGHVARTILVRHTRKRSVHFAGRQFGIGHRAEAAGLVDVNLPAMLRGGEGCCQQKCQGDQDVRTRRFDHWGKGRCYAATVRVTLKKVLRLLYRFC